MLVVVLGLFPDYRFSTFGRFLPKGTSVFPEFPVLLIPVCLKVLRKYLLGGDLLASLIRLSRRTARGKYQEYGHSIGRRLPETLLKKPPGVAPQKPFPVLPGPHRTIPCIIGAVAPVFRHHGHMSGRFNGFLKRVPLGTPHMGGRQGKAPP